MGDMAENMGNRICFSPDIVPIYTKGCSLDAKNHLVQLS
ncbi:hypothetical protein RU86_GL000573 [Lactococcus piscium]|uniref:Uncharacterized protein n=1 Tax=Pseudolactococcus piscium TaxID=1364 RepID=A0A2A5RXC4_9LACT|nr:hypothetical protein RU86_GL000573 [Lactococcus piscium]